MNSYSSRRNLLWLLAPLIRSPLAGILDSLNQKGFEIPEATKDATFLITTSWQALGRTTQGGERTMTCNCTVVLVFAAFYIEANLTHIIDEMNDIEKMRDFFHPTQFPGLKNKLSWFYNKYVEEGKATSKRELYADGFRKNLLERFRDLRRYTDLGMT